MMIFWFRSQVLENTLFPVSLHLIPILNLSMLDWVIQIVSLGVCERFITNVEVEVVDASFRRQVT